MDAEILENIVEIVSTICDLTFELNVTPLTMSNLPSIPTYLSSVHILGDWNGSVTVEMTAELAEQTARRLLGLEEDKEVDFYYVQQFMQEFVNMTGGNLKPLLGDRCLLSTPKCIKSESFKGTVPGCDELAALPFIESSGGNVLIRLFAANEDPQKMVQEIAAEQGIDLAKE
jgi:CheY-specific phosphatase CheX